MALRRSPYKTPAQLRAMIEPGRITADALEAVRALVAPGVTTAQLDAAASALITARGAESNFQLVRGYRHTTCVSVNDEVVHGIPGERVLEAGDIVSIDAGAQYEGWNGDSAITLVVPGGDPARTAARERLSEATRGALWAGIAALASASRVGEVGDAIQGHLERAGAADGTVYGILRDYVGHGIGRRMHEGPTVFNYRVADLGPAVRPGLCLAIEPMVTSGSEETFVEDDEWTVTTVDGSDGAHWEHSVAVHEDGIWVLTARDGGAAGLAPFGVTPTPIA